MKKISFNAAGRWLLFILFNCINVVALAQDSTVSSSTTTHKTTTTDATINGFEMQPWMYIVAGVVLLGIIVAIMSASNKKEVVSSTTIRDTTIRDNRS